MTLMSWNQCWILFTSLTRPYWGLHLLLKPWYVKTLLKCSYFSCHLVALFVRFRWSLLQTVWSGIFLRRQVDSQVETEVWDEVRKIQSKNKELKTKALELRRYWTKHTGGKLHLEKLSRHPTLYHPTSPHLAPPHPTSHRPTRTWHNTSDNVWNFDFQLCRQYVELQAKVRTKLKMDRPAESKWIKIGKIVSTNNLFYYIVSERQTWLANLWSCDLR
jgi:hypothetical protein